MICPKDEREAGGGTIRPRVLAARVPWKPTRAVCIASLYAPSSPPSLAGAAERVDRPWTESNGSMQPLALPFVHISGRNSRARGGRLHGPSDDKLSGGSKDEGGTCSVYAGAGLRAEAAVTAF